MAFSAALVRRVVRRLRREHGFSLVELLAVMAILSLVMAGITALFISGVRTQANLTASFQAEIALHVGLNKMRIDVHQACSQTAQTGTSVTLSLPPCDGTNVVTWCTQGSGNVYSLYRVTGSSCSGGVDYADFLTGGSIFSYLGANVTNTTPSTGSNALPRLHVDMTVNATPANGATSYRLVDDLVFRNGARQ
jgi:prepilin-type N-terminal cleavage/methylation domain-containing protein